MAYLFAQMVAFVALAQLTSTTEVGRFALGLAITSPVFALADMRTQNVQLITSPERYSYSVFMAQRLAGILVAIAVCGGIGLLFSPDNGSLATLGSVTLLKSFEGVLNVVLGEHIRRERMGLVASLQFVRSAVFIISFITLAYLSERADLSVVAAGCALSLPILVGHYAIERSSRRGVVRCRRVLSLTWMSFPLGVGFFINSVTVNAPRFLLEQYHGVAELAIFTAVSYVVVLSNSVVDSVTQGITPRLSGYWVSGNRAAILKVTRGLGLLVAILGVAAVAGAATGGQILLTILFGPDYSDGVNVLVMLLVSATLMYVASVLRTALIAGGMRRGVLIVSLANLFVVSVLSWFLIAEHSAFGVAVSLTGGQVLALLLYMGLFRKYVSTLSVPGDDPLRRREEAGK